MKESTKFHYKDNVSEVTSKLIGFILKMSPDDRRQLYMDLKRRYSNQKRGDVRKNYFMVVECAVDNRFQQGYIKNISSSGLFIEMNNPKTIVPGTPITMTFSHPDSKNHIKTNGQIVRVETSGIGVHLNDTIPLFA